jgi:hypothetical protein
LRAARPFYPRLPGAIIPLSANLKVLGPSWGHIAVVLVRSWRHLGTTRPFYPRLPGAIAPLSSALKMLVGQCCSCPSGLSRPSWGAPSELGAILRAARPFYPRLPGAIVPLSASQEVFAPSWGHVVVVLVLSWRHLGTTRPFYPRLPGAIAPLSANLKELVGQRCGCPSGVSGQSWGPRRSLGPS